MQNNLKMSVGGREYLIEFTFEACESDVVCKAYDFFSGAYMAKEMPELIEAEDKKKLVITTEMKIKQLDIMTRSASSVPKLAVDFLYMGLLEHHGENGDITHDILSRDDAKNLYKQFCRENPDDEKSMNIGLFDALKGQMVADGFFKRIGVEMQNLETPKIPQDHKKKQNTNA